MKQIIEIVKNLLVKEKYPSRQLGRWNIDYCSKKLNRKIDLSNEDHCGPCGQYIERKHKISIPHLKTTVDSK